MKLGIQDLHRENRKKSFFFGSLFGYYDLHMITGNVNDCDHELFVWTRLGSD